MTFATYFVHFRTLRIAAAAAAGITQLWAAAVSTEQPLVPDVSEAFARISESGHPLGAWGGDLMPYPFYSLNADHDFGDNHFQGVQRLRAGPYLVVSGSNIGHGGDLGRLGFPVPSGWDDLPASQGDLIVLQLGEQRTRGPLGTNIDASGRPVVSAKVVARITIQLPLESGTVLWHPGGLSTCGDVLVVPVENYSAKHGEICSQILFFDFSEPLHPRRLSVMIDRTREPTKDKAGGAAMVALPNGHLLVASRTTTMVSFYLSRTSRLDDGFEPVPTVVDEKKVGTAPGLSFAKFGGSSINFVRQTDGSLFLIGYSRVNAQPEKNEKEKQVASLWRVRFPGDDYHAPPDLTRVADRSFSDHLLGENGWGIFGAAAGIFVTDDGALAIYSTPRWQVRRMGEYSLTDLRAGRSISRQDRLFIPAIELWPRP